MLEGHFAGQHSNIWSYLSLGEPKLSLPYQNYSIHFVKLKLDTFYFKKLQNTFQFQEGFTICFIFIPNKQF